MSLADPSARGGARLVLALGLALSLGLHAAGWARALATPPDLPEELPEGIEGAVLVSLEAPPEEAAAAPAHEAPQGMTAPDVMAAPMAPETEQHLVARSDAPVMRTTPYRVEDPELAFEIANPDQQESVDTRPDEVPTETQEAQARPEAPSRAAMPPPAAGARKQRAVATARQKGLEQERRAQVAAWQRKVALALDALKTYPEAARPDRAEGRAVLVFAIDRHGRVRSARLAESTGHALLDEAALAILNRAGRLPPPPAHMNGTRFEMAMPVNYRVR